VKGVGSLPAPLLDQGPLLDRLPAAQSGGCRKQRKESLWVSETFLVTATAIERRKQMAGFSFDFTDRRGFEVHVPAPGVHAGSNAAAGACELFIQGGVQVPDQGAASIRVDNVVPRPNMVIVRGEIGWDDNIPVRVNVVVA
jgi:hypothetical protein